MKTVVSVLMVIVMTMAVACNGASVNSNPVDSTSFPTDSASVSDSTLVTERQPMDSVAK